MFGTGCLARPTVTAMPLADGDTDQLDFDHLVPLALAGDRGAWEALVRRLERVVWHAVAAFDIPQEDRKDAFAATFHRLYERLDTIREPAKLPGWVATTARNEVRSMLRSRWRTGPMDDLDQRRMAVEGDEDRRLVADELRGAMAAAFTTLRPECQALLRLLMCDPPVPYADIAETLGMPHGSIGPTRQRCLERLRTSPHLRRFVEGG
jgi:RNA polymerase sigma factor (sigma-70 family)